MADLENQCCGPAAQEACCEPEDKASCCAESHSTTCGCAADAGGAANTAALEVRETVRKKYAAAARAAAVGSAAGCCTPADETGVFGAALYERSDEAPDVALGASLGCGVPTAVADLHEGEVVLDLGSGAGADVLISAESVRPAGRSGST